MDPLKAGLSMSAVKLLHREAKLEGQHTDKPPQRHRSAVLGAPDWLVKSELEEDLLPVLLEEEQRGRSCGSRSPLSAHSAAYNMPGGQGQAT